MKKITGSIVLFILIISGCKFGGSRMPQEGPGDVVKRFYAYIREGGSTTLSEAYRLVSPKCKLSEDRFRGMVSMYPKDMRVDVIGSSINKDKAVVTIEYRTASAFGGDYVARTEINLDLDKTTQAWKIDLTGETSLEETAQTPGR